MTTANEIVIDPNHREMVELVQDFADAHPRFDRKFIDSVHEGLCKYGKLTPNQLAAVEKIIFKFDMRSWQDNPQGD